jgi:transposase-like protein
MAFHSASLVRGLRDRERVAAELLAKGKTCREISRTLGICEKTLYNWRKKPAVQRAIYAYQRDLIDASESQGVAVMPEAITTLTEIMNDPTARAADRIAASRALLNGAAAYQERKLLERTVADLESQIYGLLQVPAETLPPYDEDDGLDLLESADPENALEDE